jgi:uncharacterized membrane protein YfcA
MAGGIFIVPVLTLFFGMSIRGAIGASLVSVIACSTGSAANFLENRLTNIRLAVLLEVATTLGALTGVFLSGLFPVSILYFLFSLILFFSAYAMFLKRGTAETGGHQPHRLATSLSLHSTYPDPITQKEVPYHVASLWLGLFLMYGAGTISALLGIGSGVLKVPAMDLALRLPIKVSSATSNFMIGVTAAASAGIYYCRGDIAPAVAAPIAVGSVCGAYLGSKLMMRIPSQGIRIAFTAVLIAMGVQMSFSAFGYHMFGGNPN